MESFAMFIGDGSFCFGGGISIGNAEN